MIEAGTIELEKPSAPPKVAAGQTPAEIAAAATATDEAEQLAAAAAETEKEYKRKAKATREAKRAAQQKAASDRYRAKVAAKKAKEAAKKKPAPDAKSAPAAETEKTAAAGDVPEILPPEAPEPEGVWLEEDGAFIADMAFNTVGLIRKRPDVWKPQPHLGSRIARVLNKHDAGGEYKDEIMLAISLGISIQLAIIGEKMGAMIDRMAQLPAGGAPPAAAPGGMDPIASMDMMRGMLDRMDSMIQRTSGPRSSSAPPATSASATPAA